MTDQRSARDVIEDHLELARSGSVDEDLQRNYAPDVVCFIRDGVHRGHNGVRQLAQRLSDELPGATFEYTTVLVDGDVGFLEWIAASANGKVRDGADSYVVRDGRIVAQTIHYTVEARRDGGAAATVAPQGLRNPEAGT